MVIIGGRLFKHVPVCVLEAVLQIQICRIINICLNKHLIGLDFPMIAIVQKCLIFMFVHMFVCVCGHYVQMSESQAL